MKQKIIKIFTILSITAVVLSSCSDYLDLEPEGAIIQSKFWQNEEQVSAALAGCYASMNQPSFTEKVLLWGELRGEMMVSVGASNNANNMLKNFVIPTNGLVDWKPLYATINYCNLVLDFADGAQENDLSFTDQSLKRIKAEAIAIRSMVYLILVKNFKDVPLVLVGTSSNQIDFYPTKSTEAEILEQITTDLEESVNDLSVGFLTSPSEDKGKITQGAAWAILADAYLWNSQYDKCIAACDNIINLGKYQLVDGPDWFNDIFFEGNSVEGIFELNFETINTTYRNAFGVFSGADYVPYFGILQLFNDSPTDVRGQYGTYDRNTASVFKFAGVSEAGFFRSDSQFYNNFIFYRYADILLMQAEAYLLSSENNDINKAYTNINLVHLRGTGQTLDVTLTQSVLLKEVLLERQKELAYEGKRWHDLLRFARRNNFENQQLILDLALLKADSENYDQILSYYSDPESYFLPILQSEVNLNHNLDQNPYYDN